jgi:hypothetical protein
MSKIRVCGWSRGTLIFSLDTNISPNTGGIDGSVLVEENMIFHMVICDVIEPT